MKRIIGKGCYLQHLCKCTTTVVYGKGYRLEGVMNDDAFRSNARVLMGIK